MCYMLLHEEKHIEEPCVDYLANWLVVYVSCCVLQEFFTFLSLIIYFFLTMCLIFISTCSFMCLVLTFVFLFGLIIPILLIPCEIDDVHVLIMKIQTVMHQ